ncbi:unnamed protein product [Periconia digitata]|uniref:Uncharacterized protein n=1 Tax=Periconia digitata TaxID=1303443 RepID=A0A9W4XTY5_9PLEO|nr:unnamed protein product [Periconia digitata]
MSLQRPLATQDLSQLASRQQRFRLFFVKRVICSARALLSSLHASFDHDTRITQAHHLDTPPSTTPTSKYEDSQAQDYL